MAKVVLVGGLVAALSLLAYVRSRPLGSRKKLPEQPPPPADPGNEKGKETVDDHASAAGMALNAPSANSKATVERVASAASISSEGARRMNEDLRVFEEALLSQNADALTSDIHFEDDDIGAEGTARVLEDLTVVAEVLLDETLATGELSVPQPAPTPTEESKVTSTSADPLTSDIHVEDNIGAEGAARVLEDLTVVEKVLLDEPATGDLSLPQSASKRNEESKVIVKSADALTGDIHIEADDVGAEGAARVLEDLTVVEKVLLDETLATGELSLPQSAPAQGEHSRGNCGLLTDEELAEAVYTDRLHVATSYAPTAPETDKAVSAASGSVIGAAQPAREQQETGTSSATELVEGAEASIAKAEVEPAATPGIIAGSEEQSAKAAASASEEKEQLGQSQHVGKQDTESESATITAKAALEPAATSRTENVPEKEESAKAAASASEDKVQSDQLQHVGVRSVESASSPAVNNIQPKPAEGNEQQAKSSHGVDTLGTAESSKASEPEVSPFQAREETAEAAASVSEEKEQSDQLQLAGTQSVESASSPAVNTAAAVNNFKPKPAKENEQQAKSSHGVGILGTAESSKALEADVSPIQAKEESAEAAASASEEKEQSDKLQHAGTLSVESASSPAAAITAAAVDNFQPKPAEENKQQAKSSHGVGILGTAESSKALEADVSPIQAKEESAEAAASASEEKEQSDQLQHAGTQSVESASSPAVNTAAAVNNFQPKPAEENKQQAKSSHGVGTLGTAENSKALEPDVGPLQAREETAEAAASASEEKEQSDKLQHAGTLSVESASSPAAAITAAAVDNFQPKPAEENKQQAKSSHGVGILGTAESSKALEADVSPIQATEESAEAAASASEEKEQSDQLQHARTQSVESASSPAVNTAAAVNNLQPTPAEENEQQAKSLHGVDTSIRGTAESSKAGVPEISPIQARLAQAVGRDYASAVDKKAMVTTPLTPLESRSQDVGTAAQKDVAIPAAPPAVASSRLPQAEVEQVAAHAAYETIVDNKISTTMTSQEGQDVGIHKVVGNTAAPTADASSLQQEEGQGVRTAGSNATFSKEAQDSLALETSDVSSYKDPEDVLPSVASEAPSSGDVDFTGDIALAIAQALQSNEAASAEAQQSVDVSTSQDVDSVDDIQIHMKDTAPLQLTGTSLNSATKDTSNGYSADQRPLEDVKRPPAASSKWYPTTDLTLTVVAGCNVAPFTFSNTAQAATIKEPPSCYSIAVGRGTKVDFTLPDIEVSSRHARIDWNSQAGSWQVQDLGSLNGTFLNDRVISSTVERKSGTMFPLKHGDTLTFGTLTKVKVGLVDMFPTSATLAPSTRLEIAVREHPNTNRTGEPLPMEDVVDIHWPLQLDRGSNAQTVEFGLVCVFDGHLGRAGADQAKDALHRNVASLLAAPGAIDAVMREKSALAVLQQAFAATEKSMTSEHEGCTATALLLWQTPEQTYCQVANVGDSACVLGKDKAAIKLSADHKLSDPKERQRLADLGVALKDGENRRFGLNLGRALGDKFLKSEDVFLSAEPFVSEAIEMPSSSFAIVASDGLWDVTSAQQAVDITANAAASTASDQSASVAERMAGALLDHAQKSRTVDNTTLVVVRFL
eukprot:jgi/Chlat1/394/Chrsp10S01528